MKTLLSRSPRARRWRRRIVAALGWALCFSLGTGCLATAASCSGEDASTTGKRVVLHTQVASAPEIHETFDTGRGWTVTLSKAAIAIGALYYFDGTPAFVEYRAPTPRDSRLARLGLGVAHAHPGHYAAGNAMGQMLSPGSFDLFATTPAPLADGEGVTGTYRSARFVFPEHATGAQAGALGERVAVAEGTAQKAGDAGAPTLHFRISADYAEIAKSAADGAVEGCELAETAVEGDGTVTLTLLPHVWFALVDFTDVAPGTEAAPTEVAHGSSAQVGFALGLAQLSAFHFRYSN